MEKLIMMLDFYVRACKTTTDRRTREKYYDQAFGATDMFCLLNTKDEKEVQALWNDNYRPRFEDLVYGLILHPAEDLS